MFSPNIDPRGRRLRARAGSAFALAGVVLAWLLPRPWSASSWAAVLGALGAGAFMLFEARRGWCALRACGIKTRV